MAKKKGTNQVKDLLSELKDIKNPSVKSNTRDNTINNTTLKKPKITLDKRDNKYSDYRENLYLNENIKKKLDKVSKKTGYSKSELARIAFEYFFENLQIE